jgi:hypothetical protein
VDHDDIELLALTGGQTPYAALKLTQLNQSEQEPSDATQLASSLRQYLYDKYVFRQTASAEPRVEEPVRLAAVSAGSSS